MIKKARSTDGVRVTFALETDTAVSVVGDFNGWDPAAHQLRPRSNGKRSVSVLIDPGTEVSFRYLAEGGQFFDDAEADRLDDNGYGGSHSVLVLPLAAPAPRCGTAASSRRGVDEEASVASPVAVPGGHEGQRVAQIEAQTETEAQTLTVAAPVEVGLRRPADL